MDDRLTQPELRKIISNFAQEISQKKRTGSKPAKTVINFRNEKRNGIERAIVEVPIELLRFRKDNGRISSDVLSYEKNEEPLREESEAAQKVLRSFLKNKDPEKTKELIKGIKHNGQNEAAIITVDGFLINGNRRKMALEQLFDKEKDEKYKWMKVVILPGENDEGGPPTLKQIEQIENRYQLQSEGKSEYYSFDRALSIRRKVKLGMSVEEQLRDDPQFTDLSPKDFEKQANKYTEEYLYPLECIDEYLDILGRSELYDTVSSGIADPEGRWQAFLDFSNFQRGTLKNIKKRHEKGIEEDEIGDIQDVALKIIRHRVFPGIKAHTIMREFGKLLANKEAKKELLKLKDISWKLPHEENYDKDGKEYSEKEKDKRWSEKYRQTLINRVKRAQQIVERVIMLEGPLELLQAALKKLRHDSMHHNIRTEDLQKAIELAEEIQNEAKELKSSFYQLQKTVRKQAKQLQNKNSR